MLECLTFCYVDMEKIFCTFNIVKLIMSSHEFNKTFKSNILDK